MKILPVGAELVQWDGRTDITRLIVALRNTANAPKNDQYCDEDSFTPDNAG